jgi:TolB-like protein
MAASSKNACKKGEAGREIMAEERVQRRLAAILAADVVGYSRLMDADEAGTLARLKAIRADVLDPKIEAFRGRVFKNTGDGALVEFGSAVDAVQCAIEVQRELKIPTANTPEEKQMVFRIGISLGDVMVDGDDLFGNGVNIAARMEGLAEPGGICVSGNVQEHVVNTPDVSFDDMGEQFIKNIDRPIRVFRLVSGETEISPVKGLGEALRSKDKPSIAVLPFANRSHEEEHGYLAEGIAEDIITKLSKLSSLFVIGGHSSAALMGKSADARKVGQELDVKYVLEGAVQRSGGRVRITVKLVDSDDNHNLWTDRYDRNLTDIFDLQDEVAEEVVKALALELTPAETSRLSQKQGGSLEVYNLYQQARAAVNPPSRANTLAARSILQRVVQLDPNYAPGFAGLSLSHARAVFFGHSDNPDEDLSKAFGIAKQAIQIDNSLGICHSAYARACYAARQFDESIVQSERAVAMQPGDADSYGYLGVHLAHGCRALEAVDACKRALEIEPNFIRAPYMNQLGFAQWAAFQYEEAIDTLQRNMDRGGPPHTIAGQAYWTACLVELDRIEEAMRKATALREGFPEFTPQTWTLGHWYKDSKDTERLVTAILKTGLWD